MAVALLFHFENYRNKEFTLDNIWIQKDAGDKNLLG